MNVKKFFQVAGIVLLIIVSIAIIVLAAYFFLSGLIKVIFALSIFSVFILNGKKR